MIKWLAIKSNGMLRDEMKHFVSDLKLNSISYQSYATSGRYIYINILNPSEYSNYVIGKWLQYHPIIVLKKRPKVSDHDRTDW